MGLSGGPGEPGYPAAASNLEAGLVTQCCCPRGWGAPPRLLLLAVGGAGGVTGSGGPVRSEGAPGVPLVALGGKQGQKVGRCPSLARSGRVGLCGSPSLQMEPRLITADGTSAPAGRPGAALWEVYQTRGRGGFPGR